MIEDWIGLDLKRSIYAPLNTIRAFNISHSSLLSSEYLSYARVCVRVFIPLCDFGLI